MFLTLGRLAARFPWVICAGWLLAGLALAKFAPSWSDRQLDDDVCFVPGRFTSVRAHDLVGRAFPQDVSACRAAIAIERPDEPLRDSDLQLVDDILHDLDELRKDNPALKIIKVESYKDPIIGCRLISADGQCTLIQLNLGTPHLATATHLAVDRAQAVIDERTARVADGPRVFITGAAGIGRDLARSAGASLDGTTWATIALVIIVLLAVYRAPLLAMVPLVTIAISVWVALQMLAMMTCVPGVHLVNISKVFAIVILYGAGTDYCLFLVSRYREELEKGAKIGDAIVHATGGVGLALTASAGTVMVGLGLMGFAEFAKVRYAGPAIALSLGVALVASLTLTPALLRILGALAFWPGKPPAEKPYLRLASEAALSRPGVWDVVAGFVARRPGAVWLVSVGILLPFIALGLFVRPTYRATGELSPRASSLQGLDAIQRHFTAGEVGPVTVLLASAAPWYEGPGLDDIAQLSSGFAMLPNVAEVRSLTQPLGWQPREINPDEFGSGLVARLWTAMNPLLSEFNAGMQTQAKNHYVSTILENGKPCHVTRLDVVLESDPFDPASAQTLQTIETWLQKELPRSSYTKLPIQAECLGITAAARDLAELTESDRQRVNLLVLGAIFLILLALVRKPWLAAYLLVTVLASYYAALGATSLMGLFWNGRMSLAVDWRVPFFLFTILIAVGEDYNILLVSRAMQEGKRFGPFDGMRRAVARTGGAITSCGIIMAGTFATLMLAGLNTLMQIGFALAFGVLIDTFLVRPFLVPAFCMMVARLGTEMDETPANRRVIHDGLSETLGPAWRNVA